MNWGALVGSFYESQIRKAAYERTVNLFVENLGQEYPNGYVPRALLPAPGFRLFALPPTAQGRGMFSQNDRTFAVVGDQLVEVNLDGTYTLRPLTALPDFTAGPTVTPTPPIPALPTPNPPRVQQGGSVGTTFYGYKIVAKNSIGTSIASLQGSIATGATTLDANNFNHVSWDPVVGATAGYDIYRTAGGASPPKLLGSTTEGVLFFQDTGQAGTTQTPPTTNTSAQSSGSTSWGYKVVGVIGLGTTAASAQGTTATGQAALNTVNANDVGWVAIPNAQRYRIWRTSGPGVTTPVLLGEVEAPLTTFRDTGMAGTAMTPPAVNTSATQTLVNDGSPVSFASSGDAGQQLLIVATGKGYVLDLQTNVFALAVEGITFGKYLSGYFIGLDAATSTFRISDPLNGFVWPDDEQQQRTAGADRWIAMEVANEEVWLIGTESTEVWVFTGAPEPAFPFTKIESVFIEAGILAAFSLVKVKDTLYWLQQNKGGGGIIVRTANGYGLERISTHALEQTLRKYRTLSDAEAWWYEMDGHTFYVLSFPQEGRTWVFDESTREWHERGHLSLHAMDYSVYRPRAHAFSFSGISAGLHLVIDRVTGKIYEMTSTVGVDIDNRPIRRLRRAAHITNNGKDIVHHELEIQLATGVGAPSGQGSTPTMMLRWSDDGGFTWSNEHWRSAGALGKRRARARWQGLGSSRERVYELVMTDPVVWQIIGAQLHATASVH